MKRDHDRFILVTKLSFCPPEEYKRIGGDRGLIERATIGQIAHRQSHRPFSIATAETSNHPETRS